MDLPTYQKATWVDTPGPSAEVYLRHDVNVPVPEEGEVLVKLEFTGVWYVLMADCLLTSTFVQVVLS